MKQEHHFCGRCGKITVHKIRIEDQFLSTREKDIATCTECQNEIVFYRPNQEENKDNNSCYPKNYFCFFHNE